MIAYIQVQPTSSPDTFRVDLENHTDTLRVTELYTRNVGMDGDRYPDYKSELPPDKEEQKKLRKYGKPGI